MKVGGISAAGDPVETLNCSSLAQGQSSRSSWSLRRRSMCGLPTQNRHDEDGGAF